MYIQARIQDFSQGGVFPPPGTFLPPPQRESRVIFPCHFHSKHIGTLSLQSKEKHTFCPTKKQKNIFNKFVLCEERL